MPSNSHHELLKSVTDYWDNRAQGYSESNIAELNSDKHTLWLATILKLAPQKSCLKVLDIGTGPGFFAIILAKAGYQVTAVDATEAMLAQAKKNAQQQQVSIDFSCADVHTLPFQANQFDLIVSRNVTWNLKDPAQAYHEWYRVLKPQGKMIIFDANWYLHLFNDEYRQGYLRDRDNTQRMHVNDHYINTDTKAMEQIARQLPLSQQLRPQWDAKTLLDMGVSQCFIDTTVGEYLWSQEEKINYGSTPLFVVVAQK